MRLRNVNFIICTFAFLQSGICSLAYAHGLETIANAYSSDKFTILEVTVEQGGQNYWATEHQGGFYWLVDEVGTQKRFERLHVIDRRANAKHPASDDLAFYRLDHVIAAPVADDADRRVVIRAEAAHSQLKVGEAVRFDRLIVNHDGRERMLEAVDKSTLDRLNLDLQNSAITLVSLPERYNIRYILHLDLDDEPEFIIAETPWYQSRYPRPVQNFIKVTNGKANFLTVAKDGPLPGRGYCGFYEFTSGEILRFDNGVPSWLWPSGQLKSLAVIHEDDHIRVIGDSGLPEERYQTPPLRTPCEMFL